MNAEVHVRYLHCGDSAVAVEFGETADIAISVKVRALDVALKENPIRGITELIPTYRSEMIHYNPLEIRFSKLVEAIEELLKSVNWNAVKPSNEVVIIPIYYRTEKNEIQDLVDYEHISFDEVIRIHTSKLHYAFQMGVAPSISAAPPAASRFPVNRPPFPSPLQAPYRSGQLTPPSVHSFPSPAGISLEGRPPRPIIPIVRRIPSWSVPANGFSSARSERTNLSKLSRIFSQTAMNANCSSKTTANCRIRQTKITQRKKGHLYEFHRSQLRSRRKLRQL